MAQQDKITTIDLIRTIVARNRAALPLGISLVAVVLGTSLVLLVAARLPVTAVQTDLAAERAGVTNPLSTLHRRVACARPPPPFLPRFFSRLFPTFPPLPLFGRQLCVVVV